MRGLISTPVLLILLLLVLAGAIGLGTRVAGELRSSTLAAGAVSTATAVPPASASPTAGATPTITLHAGRAPTRAQPPLGRPSVRPPAAPPPPGTARPPAGRRGHVVLQPPPAPPPPATPPPGPARPTPAPVGRPAVYAAIGASDSVGVGAGDPATQSWVADLARRLPPGSSLHNFGVSGILLGQALQAELPPALAVHPTLVTVWLAVNDLKGQVPLPTYTHQLAVMLKTLHLRTRATVFVGNVPRLSLLPAFAAIPAAQLDAVVAQWNAAIAAVAARYGAVLVDLYTPSLTLASHPEYVSADGFHPSTLGYQSEAQTFWRAIVRHHGP